MAVVLLVWGGPERLLAFQEATSTLRTEVKCEMCSGLLALLQLAGCLFVGGEIFL